MKRIIAVLLGILACGTVSAGEIVSAPRPGTLTGVSVPDARVAWEVKLTVESKDLVQRRTDSFYFIPTSQASAEEIQVNRSVSENARYDPQSPTESWDYVAVLAPGADFMHVSLSSRFRSSSKQIERQGFFLVRPYAAVQGDVAGFNFSLEWIERKAKNRSAPVR